MTWSGHPTSNLEGFPGPGRPWWQWALGIVGVFLVIWVAHDLKFSHDMRVELARLGAQSPGREVPPDQNAAPLYLEAFGLSADGSNWDQAPTPPALARLDEIEVAQRSGDLGPLLEKSRPLFAAPDTRRTLELLRAASRRPASVFPEPPQWANTYPRYFASFRAAARAVYKRALLAARDGDLAAASDWLAVGYRMAEQVAEQSGASSQLVAYAMVAITNAGAREVLQPAVVTPPVAARLRPALNQMQLRERFAASADRDTHRMLTWLHGVYQQPVEYASLYQPQLLSPAVVDFVDRMGLAKPDRWEWAARNDPGRALTALWAALIRSGIAEPIMHVEIRNYLRRKQELAPLLMTPYRSLDPQAPVFARTPHLGNKVACLAAYTFLRTAAKRDYAQAQLDLAQQALELKLYRQAHGRYPDLLPAPGVTARTDVFSGQPLLYRRAGAGFVIYSLGQNLRDNGGQDSRLPDEGDIVWKCGR